LYIAIDKAIKRAEQLLAKRIGRIKEHPHVKVHHLAYDDEEELISK
jgi:hypothetical protein